VLTMTIKARTIDTRHRVVTGKKTSSKLVEVGKDKDSVEVRLATTFELLKFKPDDDVEIDVTPDPK
jgi:hypothetical protein